MKEEIKNRWVEALRSGEAMSRQPKSKRPKAAVARVLRPPVELRRPELAEVGLGGVVARGIREGA